MGTTNATNKSPSTLRDEYGPAPWWSEDHLAELLYFEDLTPADVAEIWSVHRSTIDDRVREYGLREGDR